MTAPVRPETLVERWRAEAARIDRVHATMGIGYHVCADELEAALMSFTPTDAPKGSNSERLTLNAYGRTCYDAGKLAALTAGGWQEIASCPKDGTWFLAWDADGGFYTFRDGHGLMSHCEDPLPTLWMPIPPLPKESL